MVIRVAIASTLILSTLVAERGVQSRSQADRVNSLATVWFRANTERNPESATEDTGWMAPLAGQVFDNSPAALARWQRYKDSLLKQVRQIDTLALAGNPASITYGILRNDLESDVGLRICRTDLWNISSYVSGWQQGYSDAAVYQRIGTPSRRKAALAPAHALPRFIDNEVANLKQGMRAGYTAPDVVVRNVIRQLDDLTTGGAESSPFYSPAQRDTAKDAADFRVQIAKEITTGINPAVQRYRNYLTNGYLPHTRKTLGVSSNPNGAACYRASTLYFSTLDLPADSVYAPGAREMRKLDDAMHEIARKDFGTDDVRELLSSKLTRSTLSVRARR